MKLHKFRRNWGPISPIIKVKQSDKLYNRKEYKVLSHQQIGSIDECYPMPQMDANVEA